VVAVLGGARPGQVLPRQVPPEQEVAMTASPRPARSGWVPAAPDVPGAPVLVGGSPDPPGNEVARLDADLREARRPSILTVPAQLRSGRLAVSSSAVVAVLALALALGCVFAVRVLWAERSADSTLEPVAVATPRVSVERNGSSGSGQAPATGTAMTSTTTGQVVVHVVGQVKRPGLVRLAAGARVADAIAAAGGARPSADLSGLNLARVVVDGEQVQVLAPGEAPVAGAPGPGTAGGAGAAASGAGGGLVNLNTADLAALDTLPGVGPVLAQRILDWRAEHGRFTSVEELGEVTGIGDKLYAQIRPKVTL
jgi:competence protein ComEA